MFKFTLLFCLFKVYLSFFILFSLIVAATIKHDQSSKVSVCTDNLFDPGLTARSLTVFYILLALHDVI